MFLASSAHAELFNRGTDSLGNQLIYDSDLNITWYDFTRSYDTWQNQMDWADALSVTYGSNTYTDWRLPITFNQSCWGYNCTNSEMGHLYYTELGNSAGGPFTNTGDFQNLISVHYYWSSTEYAANSSDACVFVFFDSGLQSNLEKSHTRPALAVHPGDVAPEPISSILFVTGGAVLTGRRYLRRKRTT